MNTDHNEIEMRIRNAFACDTPLTSVQFDDYSDLNQIDDESVRKYLPLLLIKEMQKGSKSSADDVGDHLVYFLDGYLLGRKPKDSNDPKVRGYQMQVAFKARRFEKFTKEQAFAIVLWLEEVAFQKYKRLCIEDIESAIKYWKERV